MIVFDSIIKKFTVANQLKELSNVTSKGCAIMLSNGFCRGVIPNNELYSIMLKFASDDKIIKLIQIPEYS